MPRDAEIRSELAGILGRRGGLRSGLWTHLVQLGLVARVARGEWPISRLANLYELSEETLYPDQPPRQVVSQAFTPGLRADALAEMVAHLAMRPGIGVRVFREEVLEGRLLTLKEVDGWVRRQAELEGRPAATYVRVPASSGNYLSTYPGLEQSGEEYACWLEREAARVRSAPDCELPSSEIASTLHYTDAANHERWLQIRGDGDLARLKLQASILAPVAYGIWTKAHAATFILTDLRPGVVGMRIETSTTVSLRAAGQITIRVNPRVPPAAVATAYAKARRRLVPRRDRAMSEKHLTLAVFVDRQSDARTPWRRLREQWNAIYPEWRYDVALDPQARRFALEARAAWCRVSGDRWPDRRRKTPA